MADEVDGFQVLVFSLYVGALFPLTRGEGFYFVEKSVAEDLRSSQRDCGFFISRHVFRYGSGDKDGSHRGDIRRHYEGAVSTEVYKKG